MRAAPRAAPLTLFAPGLFALEPAAPSTTETRVPGCQQTYDKKRSAGIGVLPHPGATGHLPQKRSAAHQRQIERRAPMQAMSERAGYLISSGTEPPLCAFRTLGFRSSHPHENVFVSGGGHKSCDVPLAKGPAKAKPHCLHGLQSLDLSPLSCVPFC